MRSDASLEYELQTRRPQLRLRNLGWSGDDTLAFARKLFDPNSEKGFQRLQFDLDLAAPTVVLIAYGFAEASNGADAVTRMKPGLTRLVESLLKRQRRVILMHPFASPGILTPGYVDHIQSAAEVFDRVTKKFDLPVVKVTCEDFAGDGLLPSEAGYRRILSQLADSLVGTPSNQSGNAPSTDSPQNPALVKLILKKEITVVTWALLPEILQSARNGRLSFIYCTMLTLPASSSKRSSIAYQISVDVVVSPLV